MGTLRGTYLRILGLFFVSEAALVILGYFMVGGAIFHPVTAHNLSQVELHLVWVLIILSPFVFGLIGWLLRTKITQQQIINDKTDKFESLFSRNSSYILVLDPNGRVLRFNAKFGETFGYALDNMQHKTAKEVSELLGQSDLGSRLKEASPFDASEEFAGVIEASNGNQHRVRCTIIPMVKFNTIGGYYIVMRDVSDAWMAHQKLLHVAHYDELTGLLSRFGLQSTFQEVLDAAKAENKHLYALLIDLDGFKNINDALGHRFGDEVLKIVAERIREGAGESAVVGRLGGDEFVVVLMDFRASGDSLAVAEKIIKTVNRGMMISGYAITVGASIGIVSYPASADTVDDLLQRADQAMYRAKDAGRNTYRVYLASMESQAYSRFSLEQDLRLAVREREQFHMVYQPQVDVQTNQVVGAEALIRWRHPKLGMVPPDEFIPIAEEIGLISEIGGYVLHAVCTQVKAWRDRNRQTVPISVNVSANALADDTFADRFCSVIEGFELPPSAIVIELTETSLMRDMTVAHARLSLLRENGIRIAADDFGKGYNSLAVLKQLPIDILKVDKMFVNRIHEDVGNQSIVSSLITLSHANDILVVAEGVEEIPQLQVLRQENCDIYQGYFFSKPLSAQEFEEKYLPETEVTFSNSPER